MPTRPSIALLLGPFALAYFFSYGLRTINAAIAPQLSQNLQLDDAALGWLTSTYFLSFALAQLPVGLAIDHYGPRRVNASLLLLAVAGCLLFASASSLNGLLLGRALIGLGVSGCLMTAIKSNAQWFPIQRLPALNGWVHVCGLIGAIVSTLPVAWLVARMGVAGCFTLAAAVGLSASLWLWLFAADAPRSSAHETLAENIAGTLRVFHSRAFWSMATVAALALGSHMAMQGLWVASWLRHGLHLPEAQVAQYLFWMMCAGAVGALGWGQLASRLGARIAPLQVYVLACALHLLTLLAMAWLPGTSPGLLVIGYALTGMGGSLCYAVLTARFPIAMAGRVNTALNLLVFVVAFSVQAGIGHALDLLQAQGVSAFRAYGWVFSCMAAYICLPLLWAWLNFKKSFKIK